MKKVILFICAALLFGSTSVLKAQTYVFDKAIALPGVGGYDYLSIDKKILDKKKCF